MLTKSLGVIGCALVLTLYSPAQTRISGTMHCGRPDTDQQLDVGDTSGHTISLTQTSCSWTKPLVIDGIPDTEGVSSQIGEIQDGNYTSHGYFVDTMSNGDKVFLRYEATVTMTDGEVQSVQGKWNYTGGTGKFKGIQGDGTLGGTPKGNGASYDLVGDYTLAK
jgi:hypothetical protein